MDLSKVNIEPYTDSKAKSIQLFPDSKAHANSNLFHNISMDTVLSVPELGIKF